MGESLRIRTIVFATGERVPLLLNEDGIPLFAPTLFITTQVRSRNRAANTIEQCLRAVTTLYLHCRAVDIDIEERVQTGKMLTIPEIDALAHAIRSPIQQLANRRAPEVPAHSRSPAVSLERARAQIKAEEQITVDPRTAAIRLHYIQQYLSWLSLSQLSKLDARSGFRPDYESARAAMLHAINARVPKSGQLAEREGLSQAAIAELMRVIAIDCSDNPWRNPSARSRNKLIVLTLYSLGLRASEILALKVSDIDWRKNELTVTRRPDDPEDPRRVQPTVKTLGRRLPLTPQLARAMHNYVLAVRAEFPQAAFHPFLFVETDIGRPLSKSALTKMFSTLAKTSTVLAGLSPHILRHTWNDQFSRRADKTKLSDADEEKVRSYLMGWKETSGTARIYTKRHVREAARDAMLELQEGLMAHGSED